MESDLEKLYEVIEGVLASNEKYETIYLPLG